MKGVSREKGNKPSSLVRLRSNGPLRRAARASAPARGSTGAAFWRPRQRQERAGSRGLVPPLAGGLNDGSDEGSAMAAPQAHKRLLGS